MLSLLTIITACLASCVLSFPQPEVVSFVRTSPPTGAIVVDNSPDRSPGSYETVQAGIDALSTKTTKPQTVFIYPGEYREQVYIPPLTSSLTVQGYTTDASSYENNEVDITYNLNRVNVSTNDLTATLRQWNPNTKIYNINIHNTAGHISQDGQNLAVSAHTRNQGYYGVQIIGYQDTLFADSGVQLYAKCQIVGAIDFIFGKDALAWFDGVDIRTIGKGWVTASGRDSASNPSWFVIHKSTVEGMDEEVPPGSSSLGRPWRNYARAVFQNCFLGDVIKPGGWDTWNSVEARTEHVLFGEYGNIGPGSADSGGPRANFSEQLSEPIAIETVLGPDYASQWWVDTSYLS